MAKQKSKALVLFEDGRSDSERLGRSIGDRLEEQGRAATVKPASLVAVSDILSAELYLLGAENPGAPAFGELARVFKGANLAGRKVAFFGSSGASVAWLRGLCADTELSTAHVDLIGRPEPAALAAWLKGVLANA